LKITNAETIYVRPKEIRERTDSSQDALIVKVTTDEGIIGYGEVDSLPLLTKATFDSPYSHTLSSGLREIIVGEDPFEYEKIWHKMYQSTLYVGREGAVIHAMAGIDIALWDIIGKALNKPVYKLLGGGFKDKIRAYASAMFAFTPEETAERAKSFVERGFTAVKFGWEPMGPDPKLDEALVRSIREAVGDGSKWGAHVTYITQSEPLGLAHAVKEARDFLSDSSFLMLLGDNLSQGAVTDLISQFNSDNPDALILLKEVPDPEAFGTAELNEKKEVIRVVEKAKEPRSNFAIAGIYLFTAEIHSAIAQIKPSRRGELEITDAIQKLLEMGKKVDSHILDGWWVDTGTGDDLLKANRVILDDFLERDIAGTVDSLSRITGRVQIQQAAEVANSTVRGPVSIAENCRIKNSFVGPFTSIGPGTVVENTSVEHSIILENCHLRHIQHLADSIIGKNTKVLKGEYKSNITNLVIGDDARIRS